MAERSTIAQATQIGVEVTPGTGVAATKRLAGLSLSPSPAGTFRNFRPQGTKYSTVVYQGKEWSESDLSGDALYSELQYPLSSVITTPTVAQIMDSATPTGAYRYIFDPATNTEDNPKTFTVEQGSAVRAHRSLYTIVNELTMDFSRESVELGGSAFGRAIEDGVTMTSSGVTTLPSIPVIPTQLSVYLDDAATGLGDTKLGRVLSGTFTIGSRYNPLWVVDAANPSFVAHVEAEPEVTMELLLEADAEGMALLTAMRNSTTQFVRLKGQGPRIYDGTTDQFHEMTIDMAGKVSDAPAFSDEDGVYAIRFIFAAVHDPTWGRAFKVELINTIAAL